LAASVGIALGSGGAAALAGPLAAPMIVGVGFPVAIALGVLSVAFAVDRFFTHALAAVVGLPFLLLLYGLGVGLVIGYVPMLGYAMIFGGLGLMARAVVPPRVARDAEAGPKGADRFETHVRG
jgi:hypothetical protein